SSCRCPPRPRPDTTSPNPWRRGRESFGPATRSFDFLHDVKRRETRIVALAFGERLDRIAADRPKFAPRAKAVLGVLRKLARALHGGQRPHHLREIASARLKTFAREAHIPETALRR